MEEEKIYSKKVLNRTARTWGHISAVKRMIEEERDYYDVLVQLAAIKAEVTNLSKLIVKEELEKEVQHAIETDDKESLTKINAMIDKLL